MTPDEIQTLREKHRNDGDWSVGIPDFCLGCTNDEDETTTPYPCDVIEVLDAWQNATENGKELTENCDHIRHNTCLCDFYDDGCALDDEPEYIYCPKCGVKL